MTKEINGSIFADNVIEGMGWPPEFEEWPLLRSALEFSIAWAFEKFRRGDYGAAPLPGNFAIQVLSIAQNDVIGNIDLLTIDISSRRGFKQAFLDAVAAGFDAFQNPKPKAAAKPKAKPAAKPKAKPKAKPAKSKKG